MPKPELTVVDYQIFDDPSFSDVNDGDGIVDSGETIELAVTIKNRWGKADPVTVTLSAQADGAIGPDPYVTWDSDTLNTGQSVILVRMTMGSLAIRRVLLPASKIHFDLR